MDPYKILGVPENASEEEIMHAYRRRSLEHHPDVSSDPTATARMIDLNRAYEVLSDQGRRSEYDRSAGHGRVQTQTPTTSPASRNGRKSPEVERQEREERSRRDEEARRNIEEQESRQWRAAGADPNVRKASAPMRITYVGGPSDGKASVILAAWVEANEWVMRKSFDRRGASGYLVDAVARETGDPDVPLEVSARWLEDAEDEAFWVTLARWLSDPDSCLHLTESLESLEAQAFLESHRDDPGAVVGEATFSSGSESFAVVLHFLGEPNVRARRVGLRRSFPDFPEAIADPASRDLLPPVDREAVTYQLYDRLFPAVRHWEEENQRRWPWRALIPIRRLAGEAI